MKTLTEIIDKTDRYIFNSPYRAEITDGGNVSFGELERAEITGNLCMVPFCSYGDYDNSCAVERSNHRIFLETFKNRPGVYPVYGAYGSNAIVVDLNQHNENEDMIEIISALHDYPAIDDEDVSAIEIEMHNEAWENDYKNDFIRAIESTIQDETDNPDYELPDDITSDILIEIRDSLMAATNTYFIIESGGNVYLDIKRIMTAFKTNMIAEKLQNCIE